MKFFKRIKQSVKNWLEEGKYFYEVSYKQHTDGSFTVTSHRYECWSSLEKGYCIFEDSQLRSYTNEELSAMEYRSFSPITSKSTKPIRNVHNASGSQNVDYPPEAYTLNDRPASAR